LPKGTSPQMKFPITREALKRVDPQQVKKEKYEIIIESHIKSLVNGICQDIERIILYETAPFQNPKYNDPSKRKHDELMRDKRYIWELSNVRMNPNNLMHVNMNDSILIPCLVENLKETFIGCDIIVDPLKTYLIIDWS
jgi:hypothetical protein